MNGKYWNYICVFDSGAGGISVLREITRLLPGEDIVYFGDSANAPYGNRTEEDVRALTMRAIRHFADEGVKACVIACNTATSAAAPLLRSTFSIPIIGVEPALKPAVMDGHRRILVMATAMTLRLEKFHRLAEKYGKNAEIISVPGIGIVEEIEAGRTDTPEFHRLLENLLGRYRGQVDAVVLGCTHYPFIRRQIAEVLGDIPFYDGGAGTARELKRQLGERGILADSGKNGQVIFLSSRNTPEEIALYNRFYRMP
jgi:glutamate racemase